MPESLSNLDYLDFASEAAWQAGQLTLAHFRSGVSVDRKADDSPVTVADREAERRLRERIGARFPGHAIVGEEMGEKASDRDATHRWIIDPIDGTRSFIRGVPLYGVLLGLEIAGEMAVGVAYFPALDEMIAAARGAGCRSNGRPARVSRVSRLAEALVAFTDLPAPGDDRAVSFWERLRRASRVQRGWSDCYGHCLVATGRAEVMLDPIMNVWDCAALLPILEEAGGTFTDWSGRATINGGNALSTNGLLFDEVMALMEEAPPGAGR